MSTDHPEYNLDAMKAERAALEVAIGERQRQIDAARTLAWCTERDEPRYDRTPNVGDANITKSAPIRRDNQAMSQSMSAEWRAYIEARDKSWLKASMAAVAEVIAEERKRAAEEYARLRAEFELELTKLRNEFLADRLAAERAKRPLKMVPPDAPAGMIA